MIIWPLLFGQFMENMDAVSLLLAGKLQKLYSEFNFVAFVRSLREFQVHYKINTDKSCK